MGKHDIYIWVSERAVHPESVHLGQKSGKGNTFCNIPLHSMKIAAIAPHTPKVCKECLEALEH